MRKYLVLAAFFLVACGQQGPVNSQDLQAQCDGLQEEVDELDARHESYWYDHQQCRGDAERYERTVAQAKRLNCPSFISTNFACGGAPDPDTIDE